MNAARAAARRRSAEMLEESRVLAPQWSTTSLIHGNEAVKGVVGHLADARDARIPCAKIIDETFRALVHVAGGTVDMTADDVEEICVHSVAIDELGDATFEVCPPRVAAEVHVREPAVLMTVVVP